MRLERSVQRAVTASLIVAATTVTSAPCAAGQKNAAHRAARVVPHAAGPAHAAPRAPHPRPDEHPARPIIVSVNGTTLGADESAVIANGRVLVPMRSIFGALRVDVRPENSGYAVALPGSTLLLRRGSSVVREASATVALEAPVQIFNGRVYVPLQLFTRVFGALTRYDAHGAQVSIVSAIVARDPRSNAPPPITGTVTNVDRFSSPPVVALATGSQVRTVTLNAHVPVYTADVVAGTRSPGTLEDVHVGDVLSVQLGTDGGVSEIDDSFRSRNGVAAAVSGRALALADGHLVVPGRDATITLNGATVALSAIHVGDAIAVRSNPETLEVREITASREGTTATNTSGVAISQCTFSPERALSARRELDVFLRGTPGGRARFDIGSAVTNIPMTETSPGLYRGVYLVASGANFLNASVIGRLRVGARDAAPVVANRPFSAATVPPQVTETAPRDGQTINNLRPSIYASFETPTGIAIDPASIAIDVGGRDVTSLAVRTAHFVSFVPPSDLGFGSVPVVVRVADLAGNATTYRWTFTAGAR